MGGLILVTGALLLFAVTGVVRHGNARLKRHGIHTLAWRWLTGEAWHGKPVNHTRRQIAGFLGGPELVPPGLVAARNWRGAGATWP